MQRLWLRTAAGGLHAPSILWRCTATQEGYLGPILGVHSVTQSSEHELQHALPVLQLFTLPVAVLGLPRLDGCHVSDDPVVLGRVTTHNLHGTFFTTKAVGIGISASLPGTGRLMRNTAAAAARQVFAPP